MQKSVAFPEAATVTEPWGKEQESKKGVQFEKSVIEPSTRAISGGGRIMRSIILVLAFLVTAGTSWADIVGTWKTGDNQSLTISYRDKNHVRMDAGSEGYILVSGSKAYMVTRTGGELKAMDMDEMAGMMNMFGHSTPSATGSTTGKTRFEPTGRKETIAGYKGDVYRLIHTDASGRSREEEVVLSDHPDIKELGQSWIALASRMSQIMGRDAAEELRQATQAAREKGYGGMLRSGDDMILQSLEKPSLDASHYQLPKGAEMVSMPNTGGAAAAEAGQEDYLSESAREISETAQDEAKESAKDSVKKAIRGLW
jgi:hypothetical protein